MRLIFRSPLDISIIVSLFFLQRAVAESRLSGSSCNSEHVFVIRLMRSLEFIFTATIPSPEASSTTITPREIIFTPPAAAPSKDIECLQEWWNTYIPNFESYYFDIQTGGRRQYLIAPLTGKYYYRTTQSFGAGYPYTKCDGVPRFNLTGPVTGFKTSTVAVTRTFFGTVEVSRFPQSSKTKTLEEPVRPTCELSQPICASLQDLEAAYSGPPSSDPYAPIPFSPFLDFLTGLGCETMKCRLTIPEEVVLLYWPTEVTSRDICAANGYGNGTLLNEEDEPTATSTATAITFRGQDLQLLSSSITGTVYPGPTDSITEFVMTGDWKFTSPTLYLAHRPITARLVKRREVWTRGSYSSNVEIYSSTIQPGGVTALNPSDLFSIQPIHHNTEIKDGIQYAQLVAKGAFNPKMTNVNPANVLEPVMLERVRPFNFLHVQDPVPASLYFDARRDDCWGVQSHCGTITDDTYRPRLSIKRNFFSSMFPRSVLTWSSVRWDCNIPTLVDPPVALHRIRSSQKSFKVSEKSFSGEVPVTQTTFKSVAKPGDQGIDSQPGPAMPSFNPQNDVRPNQAKPGGFLVAPGPTQTAVLRGQLIPESR
jgi:hypothetical protein